MTKARHNYIIQAIADTAKTVMPKGSEVILFGSQARGTARSDSDWDLLILLDKDKLEKSDYDFVAYPFRELGWETGEEINPIMYTKKQWQDSSFTPFYKNVEKDKILLTLLDNLDYTMLRLVSCQ